MQIQTVRLQRVFDVKRDPSSKDEATLFSFETEDGRRCLSAQLPGRPRQEPGDTVTAVLVEADNWQTLRGWKNQANGDVVVRGNVGFAGFLRALAVSGLVFALWRGATTESGRTLSGVVFGLSGLITIGLAHQQWQAWRVRKLLDNA